ncbi:MAG: inositol 2-dehydrogenase [Anaerolineae bacterium]|nr:MAG: inositol 2-dehydrogenase [Anaerolineae bacterium]
MILNVGLVGAGRIGRIHAENLANRIPNARLAAVADIDLEAAQSLAAHLNIETAVSDYTQLLDQKDLQAVVISSATDTHAQIIKEAASAGKHIFCEKPLDFELSRIDDALEAVEAAGVKLQVGFNRRFDPNFRKVREMAAEGKIGEPQILRITSRDPEPPPLEYVKASGGIFLDMTIHDFDMARYITGSEVEEVYVIGAVMIDPKIGEAGDLDTVIITLRFESGVIGTIDNSRKAVYGYDQRVELFGSEGMISTDNETPDRHSYSNADGVQKPLPLYFFLERYTESYLREMRSFVDSVQNGTPPEVTGADGRAPVAIGLAARKSYEENRPVAIQEITP